MIKTEKIVVLFLIFGYVMYAVREPLYEVFQTVYSYYKPCASPLTYSIGTFDTKFGISKNDFIKAIEQAESVWEKNTRRSLFQYKETGGNLTVNLVYDYRQKATAQLKDIGLTINEDKASYDSLKAEHAKLQSNYLVDKNVYEQRVATFNARQEAYSKEVEQWNKQGGAPKAEYEELNKEQLSLRTEASQIRELQNSLNKQTEIVNALVTVLNRIAKELNVDVKDYNKIGLSRGTEFEEGQYEKSKGVHKIDIFEFSARDELERVLAHEFGHALGLLHVEDSKAIMYRLNQSKNKNANASDITELKRACKIQ